MTAEAIALLKRLIAVPSVSRDESDAADIVEEYLMEHGCDVRRYGNNIVAACRHFDHSRPTLMLNSHIDTVKPSPDYTFPPFEAIEREGRIYGLGSNDAGASLVSLLAAFVTKENQDLPYNLVMAASCEEEVGGENGMRLLLPSLASDGIMPDMAIVGEPTGLRGAVAERGLVVLDCVTRGVTGHAARNEGANAIYRAMADIDAIRNFKFERVSDTLGPIKISVTQIEAGRQHNVVPDECRWVADIRTTDAYTNQETADILAAVLSPHTVSTPRSTRVQASVIHSSHPLVQAALKLDIRLFVSPTTSDMSLMHHIPSLKIGPGDSSRSHTADEYIEINEIKEGIATYIALLEQLSKK